MAQSIWNGIFTGRICRVLIAALFSLLLISIICSSSQSKAIVAKLGIDRGLAVYNRTLGFQKIYAIGFPSRTDKRDALILASSYSDFEITWSDGVTYEEIPEKAIPESFASNELGDTAVACWRAHLNVLAKIVEEKIETAFILEDDVDWDVNVKSQLELFARGSSKLQGDGSSASPRRSPYGNDWDMLWLGHCHSGPHDTGSSSDTQDMYFIKNDATVPPVPFRSGWWDNSHILPEVLVNDTRVIYRAASGMCMWGYAVSYEGARKILSIMSLQGGDGRQVDVQLSELSKNRDLTTYGIWPPLFGSHRFAGSEFRDSDIKDKDSDSWHPEYSANIVYSTTMNVPRLVKGGPDVISQWPNDTTARRSISEDYVDQVSGELREVNLKSIREQSIRGLNTKGRLDLDEYNSLLLQL